MGHDSQKAEMQRFAVRWTQAQPSVAAFITALVPDFHDAEDLLQRVAVTLVDKYDQYDPAQPFVGWAIGVARVEILRFRQECQRDRLIFDAETIEAVATAYEEINPDLGAINNALNYCMDKLTGRLREVFDLHYLREHAPAEVAEMLDVSLNSVFVSLHRARVSLRDCIQRRLKTTGDDA